MRPATQAILDHNAGRDLAREAGAMVAGQWRA